MPPTKRFPIRIGDGTKDRFLRFTNDSLVRLEEETGTTPAFLLQRLSSGSALSVTRLIWAGLLHAEPALEFAQVRKMIDLTRFEEYSRAILSAYAVAVGKPDPFAPEPEPVTEPEADPGKDDAATG